MRLLNTAVAQPRVFFSGVIAGAVVLAAGYLLALMGGQASATHGGSDNIHACLSLYTNQIRVMAPGQAPNCKANEMLIEWPSAAITTDLTALEARIDTLEGQVPDCMSDAGGTALFTGCNVQIVSGAGATSAAVNGLGNLIVGYNENSASFDRSGSHNLVVGNLHGYSSYGGFVAGQANQITDVYATVTGGSNNVASGNLSTVSGGEMNEASGPVSSVAGGAQNTASGGGSTVSGGQSNDAAGTYSSVSGGQGNTATAESSSVSGGEFNSATGGWSSVSGGQFNAASNNYASVGGGQLNAAMGEWSSVSGGSNNDASNNSSSVSGGANNVASGIFSSVSGGDTRAAPGDLDWVAGVLFQDF